MIKNSPKNTFSDQFVFLKCSWLYFLREITSEAGFHFSTKVLLFSSSYEEELEIEYH